MKMFIYVHRDKLPPTRLCNFILPDYVMSGIASGIEEMNIFLSSSSHEKMELEMMLKEF